MGTQAVLVPFWARAVLVQERPCFRTVVAEFPSHRLLETQACLQMSTAQELGSDGSSVSKLLSGILCAFRWFQTRRNNPIHLHWMREAWGCGVSCWGNCSMGGWSGLWGACWDAVFKLRTDPRGTLPRKEELELWGEAGSGQETTVLLGTWPLVLCAGSAYCPPISQRRGQMNATETLVEALELMVSSLSPPPGDGEGASL